MPAKSPERSRVLIVDDEVAYRKYLKWIFELASVDSVTADNAEEGIAYLGAEHFTGAVIDGLGGAWRQVVEAAEAAHVTPGVFSGGFWSVASPRVRGSAGFQKTEL